MLNRSGTSSSVTVPRKTYDFEQRRANQYRDRLKDVKIPSDLCNRSDWDALSQKIWAKFDERRQPKQLFDKKISLWIYLCRQIKVYTLTKVIRQYFLLNVHYKHMTFHFILQTILPRYSLYLVGSTVSGFALDTSDVDMCLVSRLSTNMDHRAEAVQHLNQLRAHLQDNCRKQTT